MRRYLIAGFVCVAFAAGGYWYFASRSSQTTDPQEGDAYTRFEMEAFDAIEKDYWQKSTDADLANLFTLSLEKASGATTTAAIDRASTEKMLAAAFAAASTTDAKKQLALDTLQVVLYNLPPAGRDELLTSQAVTQLRNTESNVNPATNLYQEIGVTPSATPAQIAAAYEATKAQIQAHPTATSSQALARAQYVKDVLTSAPARAQYDATGAEPAVFPHVIGSTLYLDIDKMTPTTLTELAAALDAASTTPLSSMSIDLRGNIGGDLDLAPSLIGIFVGQNQYTFDIFQQGNYNPLRSPVAKLDTLARYKEITVLTDGMTQSTAEVFTAAMKRFHLGVVVGQTTRGWGTVENTYPLTSTFDASTTYALLLVNGITLRDDGNPIEGRGVDPDVSTKDKNWQSELAQDVHSQSLISATEQMLARTPWQ